MFVKIESAEVASALFDMGFFYSTETINKKTFYCFKHSPELASVIMDKFTDARLIMDEYLRF